MKTCFHWQPEHTFRRDASDTSERPPNSRPHSSPFDAISGTSAQPRLPDWKTIDLHGLPGDQVQSGNPVPSTKTSATQGGVPQTLLKYFTSKYVEALFDTECIDKCRIDLQRQLQGSIVAPQSTFWLGCTFKIGDPENAGKLHLLVLLKTTARGTLKQTYSYRDSS